MNGIHDMGGMHGFGPIEPEANEPVFHEPWEARMFGLRRAMTSPPGSTIDRFRFLRESMPPAAYLTWSYYEHWYYSTVRSLLEAGFLTMAELRSGHAAADRVRRKDAMRASDVARAGKTGGIFTRPLEAAPRFSVGDSVVTRNLQPTGHTRLPRYARGRRGSIHSHHGGHVLADASARGEGERPEHLYTVKFAARELWGEQAAANDKVFLDLWESYLEPA
jgi:nitrile hydratase beta subunit